MKILLIGEYSNVHHTLALGLRALGHTVTVASDGDNWKDYPRDIDMKRTDFSTWGTIRYLVRTCRQFRQFRGYDVVQIINPVFLPLKAERMLRFYQYLRRHNRHIVMGAFGMDHYYVKACLDFNTFRYSDFNFGNQERISDENEAFKRDWLNGAKGILNRQVAADCDAIVAGLYEYYAAYSAQSPDKHKLHYIPFPIIPAKDSANITMRKPGTPVKLFIGIQKSRSVYKGTDIMLAAAERVARENPDGCILTKVQNVPFEKYVELMNSSEVILDQLYSYTPAMNALEGMSRGLITVGGAEPESYELMHENELRPIINVQPNEQSVYDELTNLVKNRDKQINKLQRESIEFIHQHHHYIKVARQYETLYQSLHTSHH